MSTVAIDATARTAAGDFHAISAGPTRSGLILFQARRLARLAPDVSINLRVVAPGRWTPCRTARTSRTKIPLPLQRPWIGAEFLGVAAAAFASASAAYGRDYGLGLSPRATRNRMSSRSTTGSNPISWPMPDSAGLYWSPRAEGPAWNAVGKYLLWSDIPNDVQLRRLEEDGHVSIFRSPAGNSNGNTFDYIGRQIACEHGNRKCWATSTTARRPSWRTSSTASR